MVVVLRSDDKKKKENKKRIRKKGLYGNTKMSTLPSTVYVHLLLIEVLCIHVNLEKEEKLNLKKILRESVL